MPVAFTNEVTEIPPLIILKVAVFNVIDFADTNDEDDNETLTLITTSSFAVGMPPEDQHEVAV